MSSDIQITFMHDFDKYGKRYFKGQRTNYHF